MEDDPVKRIEEMKEVRGFMFTTEDIAGLKALSLCAKPNNIDFFAVTEDSIDYLKTLSTSLNAGMHHPCLLYTSPSPRDATLSRMPSSA